MHPNAAIPRGWPHFYAEGGRKYSKKVVVFRFPMCYSIPSKGEHRATPERREHKMESEYTYNELTGQWERVAGVEVVEDTYKETRDFEHFEI